ncbi:hypothetical protein [Candidatus Nitrosocosmicus arcticus]|nr:hypothetical protein [Candidatus Nitrosocosmicus arcticus]
MSKLIIRQDKMKKMTDGLKLKISEILNESYMDIHGHEITFEKTGKFQYTSVYNINCNRKYIINLSPATVSVKEVIIPREDVVYSHNYYSSMYQKHKSQICN